MATVRETLGTNKLDETRSKENNLSMKSVGKRSQFKQIAMLNITKYKFTKQT